MQRNNNWARKVGCNMVFNTPRLEYVILSSYSTIATSGAGIAFCQKYGGSDSGLENVSAYCGFAYNQSSLNEAALCAITPPDFMLEGYGDGHQYIRPEPGQTDDPGKAIQSVVTAQEPTSTVAPARSSTHFNNNLFN